MPVLLARREPDHVAGPDLLDQPSLALGQTAASGYDQGPAKRVGVPDGASARLEDDYGAWNAS